MYRPPSVVGFLRANMHIPLGWVSVLLLALPPLLRTSIGGFRLKCRFHHESRSGRKTRLDVDLDV